MKRLWLIPLLSFIPPLHAQENVNLFGYFESQYTGAFFKSSYYQLYTNKLRLDIEADLSEKVKIGANVNIITYHGKTQWSIPDLLPDKITQQIDPQLAPYYIYPFSDRQYLDNAYLRLSFAAFDLTLGKQQISLGSGYVWNPMDLFNTKDVLDPTYEQPGHNALRLDIPMTGRYGLTVLYQPGEDLSGSGKLLMLHGGVSHFDFSLLAAEKNLMRHDYTSFQLLPEPDFTDVSTGRRLLGFECQGELLGLGVWSETAYSRLTDGDDYTSWVLGADYTFPSQFYLMAEFFQNGSGKSGSDRYDLNDWMRYLTRESKSIARDQLYTMLQYPLTDLITSRCSALFSLSDGSMALIPSLEWNIFEDVMLTAYLNINVGNEDGVYSPRFGNGGMLRLRGYF